MINKQKSIEIGRLMNWRAVPSETETALGDSEYTFWVIHDANDNPLLSASVFIRGERTEQEAFEYLMPDLYKAYRMAFAWLALQWGAMQSKEYADWIASKLDKMTAYSPEEAQAKWLDKLLELHPDTRL